MTSKLDREIQECVACGCAVTKLGIALLPPGYAVMLNPDGTHYFWLCEDGRHSVINWDRWAAFRGAKLDYERRMEDREDANFTEGAICDGCRNGRE